MRGYSIDELYGSWLDDANIEGSPDEGYPLGYYDGNGGFFFYIYYYIPGLGGWSPSGYNNYLIADGFTRVDYSLDLEADYTQNGVTPIYVEAGLDVEYIQYAVYEGELTATQIGNKVEAISKGTEEGVVTFSDFEVDEEEALKYATLGIELDKTADYTLVVVAFDKEKKAQNDGSVVFRHVTAADTDEYAVDINVLTEATPVRYTETGDYDEYNSFAFAVYGSDITEAHIALTESSKLTNNFLAALKADTKGNYTVSEDVLAQINGEGGFYDVAGGLDPDTEYAVVVWATNGNEDSFAYGLYKTEAIPEVWKPIGTGSYTDDFFTTFFNVDPQTMTVEFEQSEDDPTRFKMIYPYDSKYPYNEEGDWDDSKSYDIIVTIPDANHVYILPQKIGVDWGYGMFSICSQAGYYISNGYSISVLEENSIPFGVLEDGVITFPGGAGTTYISMAGYNNGTWYKANSNGEVKIVLPEGVSASSAPASAPARMAKSSTNVKRDAQAVPTVKSVFERDARAVKADVNVSYDRKSQKTISMVVKGNDRKSR
jgi:hypothetical protein